MNVRTQFTFSGRLNFSKHVYVVAEITTANRHVSRVKNTGILRTDLVYFLRNLSYSEHSDLEKKMPLY